MDSTFGIIAIIVLIIAVLIGLFYLILKAASYFKRNFGKSLWPGVLSLCLSIDLTIFSAIASQDLGTELSTIMYIVAGIMFAFTLYRDIRYYKFYSIPAFFLQLFLSIVQAVILLTIIVIHLAKSKAAQETAKARKWANALGVLLDI